MITALSCLMTSITVGLLLLIPSRQCHESRDGVDVYRYPAALTRALAVLSPIIGFMGIFVWHYGSTKPTGTVSAMIVIVFGGITVGGLIAYWYFSSLRIEVTDQTLTVRTCFRTRSIDFKDVIDTNIVDGRTAHAGDLQLVVHLNNGSKLRFTDKLTDFDDLASNVNSRMTGPANGQQDSVAKLKDIEDRTRNKRRETWITYIGLALVALALAVAKFA